jgi:opacity protein-like surface antigen
MGQSNERNDQEEAVMKPRVVRGNGSRVGRRAVWLTALLLCLGVSSAHSEMYIGGQVGTTFFGDNNKLSRVDLTDLGNPPGEPPGAFLSPRGSMSGRDLASSPVWGGKIGYYFPKVSWFGIELEAFYTTPHIEQGPTRVSILPGTSVVGGTVTSGTVTEIFPGDNFRVITIAPFNLMFRYDKARFQPYVGIGPGIFLSRIKTTELGFEGTQSSTKVGLNVKLGGEYFFTEHISGYGEVRYNYTRFNFDSNESGALGFQATYNPIIFSFGVGYHF